MGAAHLYTCACKKRPRRIMVGNGFSTPKLCWEAREAALNGDWGEQWKKTVEAHPQGAFDCEKAVYRCPHCEHWEVDRKKNYFDPTNGTTFSGGYVWGRYNRKLIKAFRHLCPKCAHLMHIANLKKETLICKDCRTALNLELYAIPWD